MPIPVVTANMSLTEPGVGVTLSPSWALLMNANMATIDQHNHTTGMGVLVPVAGLNINADLPLNSHSLTLLNSAVFAGAVSGTPAVLSLYSNGTDLFYKDINGNAIRLTQAGGPASGTGNIQGLPSTPTGDAGILWVNAQSTFQLLKDSGAVGANLDAGTLIVRYPGSYPTPSGNYIALQAPTALATGYALTMSATLPATAAALLLTSASGVQSYLSKGSANTVLRVNGAGTALEYSTIDTANITDSAVTSAKIADGAVTASKLSLSFNTVQVSFSTTTITATTGDVSSAVTGASTSLTASGTKPIVVSMAPPGGTGTANALKMVLSNNGLNLASGLLTITAGGVDYTYEFQAPAGSGDETMWPLPTYLLIPSPAAGSFSVSMSITLKGAAGGTGSMSITAGTLQVSEFI
jgi:hypothetical protein